jgi:hypothetical protein
MRRRRRSSHPCRAPDSAPRLALLPTSGREPFSYAQPRRRGPLAPFQP